MAPRSRTAIVVAWLAGDPAARRTVDLQIDLSAGPLALVVNVVGADVRARRRGLGQVKEFVARLDAEVRKRVLRPTDRPLVVPGR